MLHRTDSLACWYTCMLGTADLDMDQRKGYLQPNFDRALPGDSWIQSDDLSVLCISPNPTFERNRDSQTDPGSFNGFPAEARS